MADEILGATYTWTKDRVVLPETDFDLEVTETGIYKVVIEPPGEVQITNCGLPQGEARVEFYDYPEAFDTDLFQCDYDLSSIDITTFNLTEAYEMISPSINEDFSVTLHKSEDDALNNVDPISNVDSYQNTAPNEILYARVEHILSGCFSTAPLSLNVSNTQVPLYQASPVCDEVDSPDGINVFNLELYKTEIANNLGVSINDFNITFYETRDDALLEINKISEYQNKTPYNDILFYRADTNSNNACYGINEIQLTVEKLPNINKTDTSFYCLNEFPNPIKINAGLTQGNINDYTYLWNNGETSYEIEVNETGTYSVVVTNKANCSDERLVTVEPSNLATIDEIEITDVSENNIINVMVSGEGTYEFALVNSENIIIRPYQESSVFENLYPGVYNVHIKDIKNDCGVVNQTVSVIGFPKFFTPNNDGINDTWQVFGISELFQPNTKIQIYNRYGKLLKEINPLGKGWDGQIRGKKLPSDDYWFSVKLQDGRVFKNHFTLKH